MNEKEVKGWYRTLELSAHCLCEQGYDAGNLIKIAEYIEHASGVIPNPTVPEIKATISFHRNLEKQERREQRREERQKYLMNKYEEKFGLLPALIRNAMIAESGGTYWGAIEAYAEKGKRYLKKFSSLLEQTQKQNEERKAGDEICAA